MKHNFMNISRWLPIIFIAYNFNTLKLQASVTEKQVKRVTVGCAADLDYQKDGRNETISKAYSTIKAKALSPEDNQEQISSIWLPTSLAGCKLALLDITSKDTILTSLDSLKLVIRNMQKVQREACAPENALRKETFELEVPSFCIVGTDDGVEDYLEKSLDRLIELTSDDDSDDDPSKNSSPRQGDLEMRDGVESEEEINDRGFDRSGGRDGGALSPAGG